MNGWITVTLIAGTQLVIVLFLMYCASSRWWHSILILLLAVPLLRLSLLYTGDVSRHLPPGAFDEGPDGKDQIVFASASSTILQALMMAAFTFGILHWCARRWRSS